ncbi:MAG: MBL fold metallo-hydrolase [Burkholderiaceae bacterium]|nr:MBL fold metallo-hydrolase [Burkholderiaceae bacterium]
MLIYQNAVLKIHRLTLNELKTNCYIVQNGDQALLVDPTDRADVIADYLGQHRLALRYMITTHGHFDHVSGAAGVIERGLADVLYVHEQDFDEVKRAQSYSLMIVKKKMRAPPVAMFSAALLAFLRSWGLGLEHAGGHTKGSCYLYGLERDFLLTGDLALHHKLNITLFDGRENTAQFFRFIEQVKAGFAADAVILPGHGDRTTVGMELKHNKKWAYVQHKESHGH